MKHLFSFLYMNNNYYIEPLLVEKIKSEIKR